VVGVAIWDAEIRGVSIDTQTAVGVANDALKRLVELANIALARDNAIKPISLPLKLVERVDLAAQLKQVRGVSQASGPVIEASARLENPVVLVTSESLELISRLSGPRSPAPRPVQLPVPTSTEVDEAYRQFIDAFHAARNKLAIPSGDSAVWIAIALDFVAKTMNETLARLDPPVCATYDVDQTIPFDVRLKSFDGALPDCTPRMSCDLQVDRRDCRRPPNCQHNHDTRDCNRCLVSVFGRCQVRGNDPVCEAQKAAQNAAYDAGYTACINSGFLTDMACEAAKAGQNAAYSAEKLGCETNKTGLRLQCEALKELERQVKELADVSGSAQITGPVRACISAISLAPNLTKMDFGAALDANLSIRGPMKFTPLNIPGHLLGCVSSWTRNFAVTVTATVSGASRAAQLSITPRGDALAMRLDVGEIPLEAQMRPGPFEEIFERHPELVVVCPVLFGVGGTAKLLNAASLLSSGNDLAPELRGRFRHSARLPVQELIIPAQVVPLGNSVRLKATPRLEANAVVFIGDVIASP
jgi:hypothetical protein